ncbi:unnamed protein product [Ceutorhynchus assimilis]|uniref:Resistance to inhibitors of cholinesterase protein 3 N-terminal domain-containing protein n=1 Tax=Ceutorhynchus assimilis TaxID=467358 RepID=A0A9N9MNX8_9CUCU|nr:unnamed protein product [Ceutorhynchus assimilis]
MTGPSPYSAYRHSEPRTMPLAQSTDQGLGTKKTMLVLVVVVGCFAVLWPKLFYPMLVNSANQHSKPGPVDKTTGCCDVISELDFETIKIMSQLCSTIIDTTGKPPPTPKEIVIQCKKAVLETCGIDISAAFQDRISLGHSAKQILEEVRSLNGSLCLKYNFGVSPWRLGVPHRVNVNLDPDIKQERPAHLRPGMIHPAFRERGRAIPESETTNVPKKTGPPPRIVEGRPGPIPGMRPAMGGPGHVVPPSAKQQANYGFMGVLMPIYTVGFVIFFSYTIMKLVFKKKSPEADAGAPMYPQCEPDEHFYKEVFEPNKHYFNRPNKDNSKIVVNAVAALLEEVNQEIEAKKLKIPQESSNQQDGFRPNGSLPKEEDQGSVTVMGMETTASSESGKKWSRPDSPVLPHPQTAPPKEPSPPPQQIFLEGALPPQSQILVADSATEAQRDSEDDSPVVLAGKMTLSVISLDSETGTDDSTNSGRKSSDEEQRSSSGHTSEGFEKINAADLEEQINNIIEEAENIALAEERDYSPDVELIPLSDEELANKAPQINEKDKDNSVLEEIKNQFNLEDDLLQALTEKGLGEKAEMPVTDLIKEFLSNEEGLLLETDDEEKIVEELEAEEIPNLDEAETKATESSDEIQQVPEAINLSDLLLQGLLVQPDNEETSDFEPQSDIAEPPTPDTSIKDDSLLEYSDEPTATDEDQQQKEGDIGSEEGDIDEEVEEEEYSDDDEEELGENRESVERRANGDDEELSRNGAGNSQTAAENDISEDEDDDEEIEEIIEYVDNTDDEGEEIIEINGNERRHLDGNGENN